MTARFTTDPPLASATSWAAPDKPTRYVKTRYVYAGKGSPEPFDHASATSWVGRHNETRAAAKAIRAAEVEIDAIFHRNIAQRDADVAAYGEPETPHELYAGRPGSQAERIVCDCLRALQALPEIDRLYADQLAFEISKIYVGKSPDATVERRRTTQMLHISGVKA